MKRPKSCTSICPREFHIQFKVLFGHRKLNIYHSVFKEAENEM